MSFTYDPSNYGVFVTRSLIPDTDVNNAIFQDEEINVFIQINSSQGMYQSGQSNQTGNPIQLPVQVYSYQRAAATAIDVIASNAARLALLQQLLDVKIDGGKAQAALHEIAESLREQAEIAGGFAIAEMVFDDFTARERARNQLLRIQGN